MSAIATPVHSTTVQNPREQFLDAFEKEFAITMRVLRAYPADKLDVQPAPVLKSARELAWVFGQESVLTEHVLSTSLGAALPTAPESWDDVLAAIQESHDRVARIVRELPEEKLYGTVKFFTAPKTLSDVPTVAFLWFVLCDQIHHRGQFSIYTRIAGGKLPSIYGPTSDEPWF